jgi:hypothetical protein
MTDKSDLAMMLMRISAGSEGVAGAKRKYTTLAGGKSWCR